MSFAKVKELYHNNKISDAFDTIIQIDPKELDDHDKIIYYNLLGAIYRRRAQYEDGIKVLTEIYKDENLVNYPVEFLNTIYNLLYCEKDQGVTTHFNKYFKSIKNNFNLKELSKDDELEIILGKIYRINGNIVYQKRNFKESMKYFNLATKIFQKHNEISLLARTYSNIGSALLSKGDLNESISFQLKSINVYKTGKDDSLLRIPYSNLGYCYLLQGELDLAENYFEKSLKLMKNDQKKNLAVPLINLGFIYFRKGEYSKALDFINRTLKIDLEIGNPIDIAESYFNLIKVYLVLDNQENYQNLLNKLFELNNSSNNKLIDLRYKIAKALVLMKSKRLINRADAQKILLEISNSKVLEFELTMEAKLNLCESLIKELQETGELIILKEIKELVYSIEKIATDQNTLNLLAEMNILKSQLAILELDFESADKFIKIAYNIAKEKGMTKKLKKITVLFQGLRNQQDMLNDLSKRDYNLIDIVEELQLGELVNSIVTKRNEDLIIAEEKPIVFMIISSGGVKLYSRQFQSNQLHEELIAGLMTAIYGLSEDVFLSNRGLQKIKYDKYNILLKSVFDLLFCYIYQGSSFTAFQKIESLIDIISDSDLIVQRLNGNINGLTSSEKKGMDKLFNEVFEISNVSLT